MPVLLPLIAALLSALAVATGAQTEPPTISDVQFDGLRDGTLRGTASVAPAGAVLRVTVFFGRPGCRCHEEVGESEQTVTEAGETAFAVPIRHRADAPSLYVSFTVSANGQEADADSVFWNRPALYELKVRSRLGPRRTVRGVVSSTPGKLHLQAWTGRKGCRCYAPAGERDLIATKLDTRFSIPLTRRVLQHRVTVFATVTTNGHKARAHTSVRVRKRDQP
jgi:hypothetical protein